MTGYISNFSFQKHMFLKPAPPTYVILKLSKAVTRRSMSLGSQVKTVTKEDTSE